MTDRKTFQFREMTRLARRLVAGSCAAFLAGSVLLGNSPASAQDGSVMVRLASSPAQGFPIEFRDFLYCRFSGAEESGSEGLRQDAEGMNFTFDMKEEVG